MAFPVDTNNYKFIEEICMKEGKLVFNQTSTSLGHTLFIKNVTISAYTVNRIVTLQDAALVTDNQYKILKGSFLAVNQYLGYYSNQKQYKVTAIDSSNPSYDLVTLSNTLGIAMSAGDTLFQFADFEEIDVSIGVTMNGGFDFPATLDYYATSLKLIAGATMTIELNKLLQQGEALFVSRATTEINGAIGVVTTGYRVSADTNFKAKRVIYGLGDSIANPSSYVTRYNGHMWNIAKLEVNKSIANGGKAYDARLAFDSMSGKTSTDLVNTLKAGRKVIDQADVILFQHGVNDAYQGTTDLVWNQNLQYMIDWRDANYPNAKLVFLGATPLASSETTENARLVELRAIQATYEDIPNNVYYFGMDTIILPNYTASSTYFTDAIHPTQASHDLYGAGLGNFIVNNMM